MQYSVLGPTRVKVSRIYRGTATVGVAPPWTLTGSSAPLSISA
jgi:hypothetical protein